MNFVSVSCRIVSANRNATSGTRAFTQRGEKLQHKRNVWRSANIYRLNRMHVQCALTKRYLRSYGNLSTINSGLGRITPCYYSIRRRQVNAAKAEITCNWMENGDDLCGWCLLVFEVNRRVGSYASSLN